MDVIENHAIAIRGSMSVVYDVAKDDASLGGRDLDRSFDSKERVGGKIMRSWAIDQFEITKGGKLNSQVLQRRVGLVDNKDIYKWNGWNE